MTKSRTKTQFKREKQQYLAILGIFTIISVVGTFLVLRSVFNSLSAESNPQPQSNEPEVLAVDVEKTDINLKLDRNWVLKGMDPYDEVDANIELTGNEEVENLEISIGDELIEVEIEKGDRNITRSINVSDIQAGKYEVSVKAVIGARAVESEKVELNISYPVFVAWTMDWEGGDTTDEELENLLAFQKKYGIPVTHFFNPSIYITDVPESRQKMITNWILARQAEGDEIGLHLHMHYDLVEGSGVDIRKEPQWTDYLDNGHDVPSSAYSTIEYEKILAYSKELLEENGLNVPTSFRAGGWFANLGTLQALENEGFEIDSSGRDRYIWGAQGIDGHWNLTSTTQPYKPSKANQNQANSTNSFLLWEFPNNGGNSWFEDQEALIGYFENNYSGGISHEPITVNYLSHPHLISKDIEILDPVYGTIDKYNIDSDSGPVIYLTLNEIKEYLENEQV